MFQQKLKPPLAFELYILHGKGESAAQDTETTSTPQLVCRTFALGSEGPAGRGAALPVVQLLSCCGFQHLLIAMLQLGAGEAAVSARFSLGCSKKGETPPKVRDGGDLDICSTADGMGTSMVHSKLWGAGMQWGGKDGAPVWSVVVGTDNGVGFVPLLKTVPPSYLLVA